MSGVNNLKDILHDAETEFMREPSKTPDTIEFPRERRC